MPAGTGTFIDVLAQFVGVPGVPLKVTALAPCDEPKLVPLMVTEAPTAPDVGVRLVILGVGKTVKLTPVLATPFTVITTLPVAAPVGTGTCIDVLLHMVGVAVVLSKTTVLLPCVAPKFVPTIVTTAPTGSELGVRLVMLGVGRTVKLSPLLATALTVTTTLPVVAPAGTGTLIEALAQVVGVPGVPLNVTVLVPWEVPKPVPLIVTDVPTAPDVGVRLVMLSVAEAHLEEIADKMTRTAHCHLNFMFRSVLFSCQNQLLATPTYRVYSPGGRAKNSVGTTRNSSLFRGFQMCEIRKPFPS